MFSQYRNRIIALFLTVCLLVTSLCVPVGAVSADGIANYNDFSGSVSFMVNGEYQYDDFTVGNGPLSFSGPLYGNANLGNTYGTLRLYPNFTLSAGDSFDLTVMLPERVYSGFYSEGSLYMYFYHVYTNDSGSSSSYHTQIQASKLDGSVIMTKSFLSSKHVIDQSQSSLSPITDSNGNLVGFRLVGVLLYDLTRINFTFYPDFSIEDDASSTGTLTVNLLSDDWISLYSPALVSDAPDIPDSTVTDAALTIETIHAGDDFMSSAVSVSGLSSTDAIYNFRAYLYENGTPLGHVDSDAFAGPFMYWHITKSSLIPETEYTLEYVLLENGEETSVTASQTFTTIASTDTPTVDDTQTLSLLSAILAAINDQNDRQENEYESIVDVLGMLWLRLRYIEENTAAFAPSKEETALKEAAKETTQAVVDKVFAGDSATKVTANDIGDMADSGKEVVNAFDTGTTVGDFFSVFTDYVFTGWFSEETRANLDSVNSVSTFGLDDDPYNHDSYNKNMEALNKFLERSGKVND